MHNDLWLSVLTTCVSVCLYAHPHSPCVQDGGLQRITEDISRGVRINCGKKAIVLSHSYGANVMATIFQKPEFAQWR